MVGPGSFCPLNSVDLFADGPSLGPLDHVQSPLLEVSSLASGTLETEIYSSQQLTRPP